MRLRHSQGRARRSLYSPDAVLDRVSDEKITFRDTRSCRGHSNGMAKAPRARTAAEEAAWAAEREVRVSPELEAELVAAMEEIDRGEYIELTREQLDRAAETGEWPWPEDESLD